jgi:2-oxoglutarate dehydrogenase E1 component
MAKSSLAEMAEGTRFQRLIPEVLHPNPLSKDMIDEDNNASTPSSENWQRNNAEPRIPYSLVDNKNYPLANGEVVASPSMMNDEFTLLPPAQTTTLIFCSGQVYYLLSRTRALNNLRHVAIVRVEQFTPFPWWEVRQVVDSYAGLEEVVWCQEEPWNAGAWSFVCPRIETVLRGSNWMKNAV